MANEIVVREATEADDDGVNRLFAEVFGVERSLAQFRWKTYDCPDGPMVAVVAVCDGVVVGYYGFWATPMRVGGKVLRGGQALDIMLHPKHRGLPLALRLCSSCIELAGQRGMVLLYGLPNALALRLQVSKLNSDHAGDVPQWARVLSSSEAMGQTGWKSLAIRALSYLPLGSSQAGLTMRWGIPTEAQLADFLDRVKLPHGRLRVATHPARLLWRFHEYAGRNYRWAGAWDGDILHGLVVLGDHPAGEAMLSEMMGDSKAAQVSALSFALRESRAQGVRLVHALSTQGARDSVLKACGFHRRRQVQPLVVHKPTLQTLPANPHVFDDWVIFGSDHDVF